MTSDMAETLKREASYGGPQGTDVSLMRNGAGPVGRALIIAGHEVVEPDARAIDQTQCGQGTVRRRRVPMVSAKPGELKAAWGRAEFSDRPSVCYAWGGGGSRGADGRVLANAIEEVQVHAGRSLVAELEARGYDLRTLKFSIQRKVVSDV